MKKINFVIGLHSRRTIPERDLSNTLEAPDGNDDTGHKCGTRLFGLLFRHLTMITPPTNQKRCIDCDRLFEEGLDDFNNDICLLCRGFCGVCHYVKMERWIRLQNDEIVRDVPKNIKKIEEIGILNEKEICPECGNETIVMCPHCDFAGIKLDDDDCPVCKHPIIVYQDENENQ